MNKYGNVYFTQLHKLIITIIITRYAHLLDNNLETWKIVNMFNIVSNCHNVVIYY